MSGLPDGWVSAELGNAVTLKTGPFGSSLHQSDYVTNGIPLVNPMHIVNVRIRPSSDVTVTPETVARLSDFKLKKGDLVLARRGEMGRCAVVQEKEAGWLCGTGSLIVRPEPRLLDPDFLQGFLSSASSVKYLLEASVGSTMANLNQQHLLGMRLPLPPLSEQNRIVEKLEELLSDLDTGVAELKAAQKKLAQYRQSLLKAAVEGALTAEWRAARAVGTGTTTASFPRKRESSILPGDIASHMDSRLRGNDGNGETGGQLLQRILTERRARWEAKQLAKFKEQGKAPPKDWQKKYPEPVQPDTSGLPELPQGWVWATLSQVGWLDRGKSMHRPRNAPHLYGGPYPFVQTGDIRHADTFLSKVESSYSEEGLAQSRLWPAGTMCITIAANIGKTAILAMDACFPDSVVGFLSACDRVSSRYVEYFMRSAQQQLENDAPATAQKNINIEILSRLALPLPPAGEQLQIVAHLDALMQGAADFQSASEMALRQSTAQRQNILRAAFAGQLVPQDPADEPASVLLERIRAERAARNKVKKPRGHITKGAA